MLLRIEITENSFSALLGIKLADGIFCGKYCGRAFTADAVRKFVAQAGPSAAMTEAVRIGLAPMVQTVKDLRKLVLNLPLRGHPLSPQDERYRFEMCALRTCVFPTGARHAHIINPGDERSQALKTFEVVCSNLHETFFQASLPSGTTLRLLRAAAESDLPDT